MTEKTSEKEKRKGRNEEMRYNQGREGMTEGTEEGKKGYKT